MNAPTTATATLESELDDYELAKALVLHHAKSSTSWLQRQLGIGYNTAHQLIERMEAEGVLASPDHVGRRAILAPTTDARAIEAMAVALQDRGARLDRTAVGTAQLIIPVELPTGRRSVDDRLRLLIERIERLEEEKKGIKDDIKDVYSEAKATGYDARMMREIVRLRKMKPDDRREREAVLETYKNALGID